MDIEIILTDIDKIYNRKNIIGELLQNIETESINKFASEIKNIDDELYYAKITGKNLWLVMEHVNDIEGLMIQIDRIIKPNGIMFHNVDYRDHFFSYPYNFLLFSKKVWELLLNPGDLPRWRINDHIELFERHNYLTEILHQEVLNDEFEKIKYKIHKEFADYSISNLQTTGALIFVNSVRNL